MPTFYTLVTVAGQGKLANALATGTPLLITKMAVGDGNGNPVTVTDTRTALVRETYKADLNSLRVDTSNPSYMIAELVVPMSSGGYTVRECGLFDVDGTLIAYGNFPDTYKPLLVEGSGRELVVRMVFQVANAATVQLKIDPTIVLATRAWVLEQLSLANLAPGGLIGQVLMKDTNADGDASWQYPGATIINVNAHEETQTCAAGQTVFTLSVLTTVGVSAYVEGGRISLTVLNATQVQTSTSYPAGTSIVFVQNEPNSNILTYGRQTWKKIANGQTLAAGTFMIPDNGTGIATYVLPANPLDGDAIEWREGLLPFSTYALRLMRNGKTIMGVADDLEWVDDFNGRIVWSAPFNTWRLDRTGVSGVAV